LTPTNSTGLWSETKQFNNRTVLPGKDTVNIFNPSTVNNFNATSVSNWICASPGLAMPDREWRACGHDELSSSGARTRNRVTADVRDWQLLGLLEAIAGRPAGTYSWSRITASKSSVKFKDLPPGQALRLLLGDLNFALVPQTNATQRLYVFRTTMKKRYPAGAFCYGKEGSESQACFPTNLSSASTWYEISNNWRSSLAPKSRGGLMS